MDRPTQRFMIALTQEAPAVEIAVGPRNSMLPYVSCWTPLDARDPDGPIMLSMESVDCVVDQHQLRIQLRHGVKYALISVLHEAASDDLQHVKEEVLAAVAEVHDEVKTGNALTAGALLDNQESRRILAIAHADRTESENDHLEQLGIQKRSRSHPA